MIDFDVTDTRTAARAYAAAGLPVFPLAPRTKAPLTEHGFKDATTDPAAIAQWWEKSPGANIGIPTGEASGWLVVDVDPRNGGGASWDELTEQHGCPDTLTATTGGGGLHLIFRWPGNGLATRKEIAPGIEIKGNGGYIVVAPSIHPDGPAYRWEGLQWTPPAELPAWLYRLIEKPAGAEASGGGAAEEDLVIPAGKRNETLASIAGSLRKRGLTAASISDSLIAVNRHQCSPPLPEEEVRRIAGSIGAKPAGGLPKVEQVFNVADIPMVWNLEATGGYWIVPDFISQGTVTLVTGDSGVGKSTLIMAMVYAVATGGEFLGRTCVEQPVLVCDAEQPLATVKERLERLRCAPMQHGFYYWGQWVDPAPSGPASPAVIRWAEEAKGVIVFDSLAAFHQGSENDAAETRKCMNHYRRLASMGATVILIHHTGKAESARQFRGSSDIKASVDSAYLVSPFEKGADKIERLKVETFKSRMLPPGKVLIDYVEDRFDLCRDDKVAEEERVRNVVYRIVSANPGIDRDGITRLAKAEGVGDRKVDTELRRAKQAGWYYVEAEGRAGKERYRTVDAAEEWVQ